MNIMLYDSQRNGEMRSWHAADGATETSFPSADKAADVVIVDVDAPGAESLAGVVEAARAKGRFVFGITSCQDRDEMNRFLESGLDALIPRHATTEDIRRTLAIVQFHALKSRRLAQRVQELERKLEDRIVIERAKGIIIQRAQIGEDEAFRRLRREARNRGRTIREIAQIVLDADRVLKKHSVPSQKTSEARSETEADHSF